MDCGLVVGFCQLGLFGTEKKALVAHPKHVADTSNFITENRRKAQY